MSTELRQRLADLASHAPASGAGGAAELWAAGKRRQRRRTAAGAGALVACLLVVLGAVGSLRPGSHPAFPVGAPDAAGALPRQLHVPGRWLASNEDDPVGPFAVVSSASRGWLNNTDFFGISARTGEYRFFDLPGLSPDSTGFLDDVALSPSGRYVAYWLGPEPDGEWDETRGQMPSEGVAVYDTTSGEVERREMESPHGLSPWSLRWVDDERLYLQAGEILGAPGTDDASGSRMTGPGWIWRVTGNGDPTALTVLGITEFDDVAGTDGRGRLLVDAPGREPTHLLVDPDRPTDVQEIRVRVGDLNGAARPYRLSGEGRIAVASNGENGDYLVVTSIDGASQKFPGVQAWSVAGWADASHVVVGLSKGANADREVLFAKVDVTSGESEPFIDMPETHLNPPQLASALLAVPPVDRGEPDWPTDPRIVVAGAVGALLLLGYALRVRRRRGRA